MLGNYRFVVTRVLLGGLSNSVSRLVVNTLPLYPFGFIRQLLISILSWVVICSKKEQNTLLELVKKDKVFGFQLIVVSVLSAVGSLLFYTALKQLPVSVVSIFENGTYVIIVMVMSAIFLKETLHKHFPLYASLILIGLTLIITKGKLEIPDISFLGIGLLLLNSILTSVKTVFTAFLLKKSSAKNITFISSFATTITFFVLMLLSEQSLLESLKLFTIPLLAFILFGVVNSYVINYLQNRSIQVINSSKTAVFQLLTPVLSSVIAMLIFGEWFNILQFMGMGLIIFCVWKLK